MRKSFYWLEKNKTNMIINIFILLSLLLSLSFSGLSLQQLKNLNQTSALNDPLPNLAEKIELKNLFGVLEDPGFLVEANTAFTLQAIFWANTQNKAYALIKDPQGIVSSYHVGECLADGHKLIKINAQNIILQKGDERSKQALPGLRFQTENTQTLF